MRTYIYGIAEVTDIPIYCGWFDSYEKAEEFLRNSSSESAIFEFNETEIIENIEIHKIKLNTTEDYEIVFRGVRAITWQSYYKIKEARREDGEWYLPGID